MSKLAGGELQEPKVEQLMGKLRRLQQGKTVLEKEIREMKSVRETLQKDLETFQAEAYQLEGIQKEREEMCRKLQVQCEESGQDTARQLKQNKASEELLEQYRCEIQQLKLKHRKQRMRFENQLEQLMEQHKKLHSVFAPERLPDELKNAENTKSQLLSAEQQKLSQLKTLDEELEKVQKRKLSDTGAAPTEQE
ncbi:synaptonemal complex central element protein 1 [Leuresthes tenuis]|uniref:synaptonemal complex central element protein 1 n=1 Tax=Leuresthes tenuis TaxID=355514 RepID=UPI003B509AFE